MSLENNFFFKESRCRVIFLFIHCAALVHLQPKARSSVGWWYSQHPGSLAEVSTVLVRKGVTWKGWEPLLWMCQSFQEGLWHKKIKPSRVSPPSPKTPHSLVGDSLLLLVLLRYCSRQEWADVLCWCHHDPEGRPEWNHLHLARLQRPHSCPATELWLQHGRGPGGTFSHFSSLSHTWFLAWSSHLWPVWVGSGKGGGDRDRDYRSLGRRLEMN